jgi:hypothetical protein
MITNFIPNHAVKATIIALLSLLTFHANAQKVSPPVKGKFYLYIDDSIHLYLNGTEILALENTWKSTQTDVVELKPGDRIVARIGNAAGQRGFMLLFVSSGMRQAVQFTHSSFKNLPDPSATDFKPDEIHAARTAKPDKTNNWQPLPFKNRSEWVWGETNYCTLGAIITAEMFRPFSR